MALLILEMTARKATMLTAQELVQLRVKVDRTLPTKGMKEFQPCNSWLEKKQIQTALEERKNLLEEERVERLGALTRADWDPELKIARVTCRVGRHWKQMGHEVGGKLYLFPEEALFLLETACLELMYNGVAISIQEGYSMLLGPETGCTFNEYQTYTHLTRQGYIVLRHSQSVRATRYECQIRLHQYSVGQKQHKENVGATKPSPGTEDMTTNVKTEEQDFIDVETVETVDITADGQNVTQKTENEIIECSDIVDVSDSSQTSHTELKIESAGKMRCDKENKTSSENADEIEVVSVVNVRIDADNEIVEVNHEDVPSTSAVGRISRRKQRRAYQNTVKSRLVNKEIQVLPAIKLDVDSENDAATNVSALSVQNSDMDGLNIKQPPNETAYLGRGKVTNINLEHDEVEILPSIIDISEEDGKQGLTSLKLEDTNSTSRNEIEVVDLEDDDSRSEMSWEAERMRILESIPSINGKFIIHVQVPDKDLLPKNVCPQKKDYYIQRCRLSAPGIGGKQTAKLPNNGPHVWQDNQSFHPHSDVNPWIHAPAYNFGGGNGGGNMFGAAGVWSSSSFQLTSPFRNQHYQSHFPAAYELQTMFFQTAGTSPFIGNPAWLHNTTYGMPALAPMLQNSRNPHDHRPMWHNHTRSYQPFYKRRRRRFQTLYYCTPNRLGKQHSENQTNSTDDFVPLTVEVKVKEEAPKPHIKEEGDGNDGDVEDVVECVSVNSAIKVENPSADCASGEGQQCDGNKNGTDACTVHQRRKRTRKLRCSVPAKKLQTLHEQVKLETKEDVLTAEAVDEKSQQQVLQQEDMAAASVSTWKDLKTVMQVVNLDSSSEDDDICVDVNDTQGSETQNNEPLVRPEDCKDIDLILKKLQIIKSVDFKQEREAGTNDRLKISFDLYLPSPAFRKASPGLPNYRITVVGYEDPMPEPKDIIALLQDFQDDVPLLFAVVLPDTVTFLQFGSVRLPAETVCP